MTHRIRHTRRCAPIAAILSAAVLTSFARAGGYEAPTSTFGVGSYYSSVTPSMTGNTLRLQLHTITSSGFTSTSYGDARSILPIVWTDPANPLNMIQIYDHTSIVKPTGGSIPGWEYSNNQLVWNREHIWPQHWLGVKVTDSYSGPASDLFELAPADPNSNGSRGDDGYGNVTSSGAPGVNGSYFFPGDTDKGDAARSILYMATRYYTGCTTLSINNLQLVNGSSYTTFQMGDLQSLLHYNYEDGIDNFERQRNQTIQSYQGDRNPFIDHPEYVWAIFGNTTNSSQISVGTPATNGSSSANVTLPRVMVGGTLGSSNVTVTKTGATPTTFDITGSGNATTILGGNTTLGLGTGQPFDYGNVTKTMTVSLNASTATAGLKSGTLTLHNTDLTTAGTGQGSADGDDTVSLSAAVLAKRIVTPSQSSFSFGNVIVGGSVSSNFTLSTTGDDNSATRVNVAGSTSADSSGISISGNATLFNSASVTGARTIGGAFTTVGDKSGNLSLPVATAENSGAGLTGEGTYASIATSYTAKVLAHSNASFNASSDVNSLTLDFGLHAQNSGNFPLPFSVSNLIATANFTAGLDLDSIGVSGNSSAFTTSLATFSNESAGSSNPYNATINTTTGGTYDATYTLNVSDQNLPGATTGSALTLHLIGTVSSTQTVATLTGNANMTLNAVTLVVTNGGNYSGALTDGTYPGSLVLTGGTLIVSGANSCSGGTTANNNSTLAPTSNAALGSPSSTITLDNSTFEVDGTSFTTSDHPFLIKSGGGTFNITDPNNSFSATGSFTVNGPLAKTGPGSLTLTQPLSTAFPIQIAQSTLILPAASNTAAGVSGNGTLYIPSGATLISDSVQLGTLHIDGAAQIRSTANVTTSTLTSLTLGGTTGAWTGALDLTSNKLIVEDSGNHTATLSTLKDEVAYGQTHPDGIYDSGIDANHRVVVVDNAILGKSSFGTDPSLDAGSIIVAAAILGDTDLSGTVDLIDLQNLALHWQQSVSDWSQGDFDGSGFVDLIDVQLLATHWQLSDSGGSSSQSASLLSLFAAPSSTPEPSTLLLLAPLFALRRRPR